MSNRAKRSSSLALCLTGAILTLGLFPSQSHATTRRVGPGKTYSTIRAAALACQSGDSVLVDPGTYTNDVATWNKTNLVVKAADPANRPVLNANGSIENNQAVWHVPNSGMNIIFDGFEIYGAIDTGFNGAAVRVESGNSGWITIRNCHFHDNQMNILAGCDSLTVEHCELDHTRPVPLNTDTGIPGNQHNIYVNTGRVVVFRYNYSHDSWTGHPFKSRAQVSYILYNRLDDGTDNGSNSAGLTIDTPDGGMVYVIGNIIEQSTTSQNTAVFCYACENSNAGISNVFAINNTFINEQSSGGTFINMPRGGSVTVKNNIFYGPGTLVSGGTSTLSNNYQESSKANGVHFANVGAKDYHLTASTPGTIVNAGTDPGNASTGYDLMPTGEYVYDTQGAPRSVTGALDLGAFEYGSGGTGGSDVSSPSSVRDLRNR